MICELCTTKCELSTVYCKGVSGGPFVALRGAFARDRKTGGQIHFIDTLGFARHTKYGTRHPPEKSGWLERGADMLSMDVLKMFPVCTGFCNFYDVRDGFLLRCTSSDIGSGSLFVSSTLTLDGSKLFPACIRFFEFYAVVDRFLLCATC